MTRQDVIGCVLACAVLVTAYRDDVATATRAPRSQDLDEPRSLTGALSCQRHGWRGGEYAQPTYELEDLGHGDAPGTGDDPSAERPGAVDGPDFGRFEACLADLATQPTGPATTAALLDRKACVSFARFFLAFDTTAAQRRFGAVS